MKPRSSHLTYSTCLLDLGASEIDLVESPTSDDRRVGNTIGPLTIERVSDEATELTQTNACL